MISDGMQLVAPLGFESSLTDTNLGIVNHGHVGGDYLATLGFGPDVTEIVRAHVLAKKYLCYKMPSYYESASLS
jgi:predicted HD phosphohydrolase